GQRLFEGDTVSDTLAAVLKETPDWNRVPARVRTLVRRCLERDPKRRLRDIGDAMPLVENEASVVTSSQRHSWVAWDVAAVFAVAATAVSVIHFREVAPAPARIEFSIASPEDSSFPLWAELSPDGKYLAYGARKEGSDELWLRPLNSQQARPLI